jgi:hypothetical protein
MYISLLRYPCLVIFKSASVISVILVSAALVVVEADLYFQHGALLGSSFV